MKCTPKILYVIGAGHSGSTLFDVLLSLHPEIIGTGEVHRLSLNPDERLCGCGKALTVCPFWSEIIEDYKKSFPSEAEGDGFSSRKIPPLSIDGKEARLAWFLLQLVCILNSKAALSFLCRLSNWVRRYVKAIENSFILFDVIAANHQASIVVDSTKTPLRGRLMSILNPEGVLFIHLVRDGRAVAASMMKRESVTMKYSAKSWKKFIVKTIVSLWLVPATKKKCVRYEDLCSDPKKTVKDIWSWLHLPSPSNNILDQLSKQPKHQIPGNPVLYGGIDDVVLDEKWRHQLSNQDLYVFEKVSGKINEIFGYKS